jgi:hypothetical protein
VADTMKQELEERAFHTPRIQVSMPQDYGVPSMGGRWENTCIFTNLKLSLTKEEWDARYQKFRDEAADERRKKFEAEQAERDKANQEYLKSLPTKQRYIQGAQRAKRILGKNKLLGILLKPHPVKMMIGGKELIIPANCREVNKDFTEVMLKSDFIRVIMVCPFERIDRDKYEWLWEAKTALDAGLKGPIIEIAPGAGLPRRGENGEACIFIDAEWCMMEYPDPDLLETDCEVLEPPKSHAAVACAGCATDGEELPDGP